MTTDVRISAELPKHPKFKKLIRRLGAEGGLCLIWLFLWAAANRSDGDLSGLSDEDIELAIDWSGEAGEFVRECVDVGFLDGDEFDRSIHDWDVHNPWAAGADMRSAKARWNAVKRHHGEAEADRQVPEYAAVRIAGSNAAPNASSKQNDAASNAGHAASTENDAGSNAPSPSPIRNLSVSSPSPKPKKPRQAEKDLPPGFLQFWTAWPPSPRKEARGECAKAWAKDGLETFTDIIVAHVTHKKTNTDWAKEGGKYVEAPIRYLNHKRWDGADLTQKTLGYSTPFRKAAAPHSGFSTVDYEKDLTDGRPPA
jgi:hypothetical protein